MIRSKSLALGGVALAEKYEAQMYVAGMGGPFADAKIIVVRPLRKCPWDTFYLNNHLRLLSR